MSDKYKPYGSRDVSERPEGLVLGARARLTMSDFGATDQFSLHRFESPLTTSALLPMRRNKPMTFLRHVPILEERARVRIRSTVLTGQQHSPSQHVTLLGLFEN